MIPEEGVSSGSPPLYNDRELILKFLAIIIIVTYLFFLLIIARLYFTFIPQMEEAGEETAELISGTPGSGGAVQVIHHGYAQEIRLAYIISLISFGILDMVFALMLLFKRVKRGHETALFSLSVIQIINRPFSAFVIVQFSILVFVESEPGLYVNALYLIIAISSILSSVLAFIVYIKLLRNKTRKFAYKIREKTSI